MLTHWFDPAALAVLARYALGSARRDLFGLDYFTWDWYLMKNTALTERLNLEFHAESFNALNHRRSLRR